MTIPPLGYPTYVTSTLLTISLLYGRWSTSGSNRGNAHFLPLQEYNRGNKRKKRTNEQTLGVNSRAERGVMQHYISDSIYGLMLAWISSENSTKQLECQHLDSIFFAGPYLMLPHLSARVSTVDRLCPCPVAKSVVSSFYQSTLLVSHYHFRTCRDFKSKNPLSGFAPKQTKELSAWRATYIVLQVKD